ncbi:host attachment protein [Phenylobacterium soli]|uniref:Host attachment protein n=1 Tax=Phenylobacterium soli TaxID=2170551 RepID=A0A328AGJ4_9CAUL|nr:host attachment protein [Phenylobacterium soli]RAK53635.1 hypothetical protein DJ017_03385 [Phenylobacterium soli]
MPHLKMLYVLADGAHARLVERSHETGDFVTFAEIDGSGRLKGLRRELKGNSGFASQQSGTNQRHDVHGADYERQAKETFVHEVADRAAEIAKADGYQGVVVAAPARLLEPLRTRLAQHKANVAGALDKDLTKAADATLSKWLDHVLPA